MEPPAVDIVVLPRAMVQVLYDLAINSLDFGSGFWGDEEYMTVKRLADMLGFDYPTCDATIYPPGWDPKTDRWQDLKRCGEPKGHPASHKEREATDGTS